MLRNVLAIVALVLGAGAQEDPKLAATPSSIEVFNETITKHAVVLVEFTHKGESDIYCSNQVCSSQ